MVSVTNVHSATGTEDLANARLLPQNRFFLIGLRPVINSFSGGGVAMVWILFSLSSHTM